MRRATILIQCGDHLENQARVATLAKQLFLAGHLPVVLLYNPCRGRLLANMGIRTIHMHNFFAEKKKTESERNKKYKYNISPDDIIRCEKLRNPTIEWPGQIRKNIASISLHIRALENVFDTVKPDIIIPWNGFTGYTANILRLIAKNTQTQCAFIERGLFKKSIFLDKCGVNGASSLNNLTPNIIDGLNISDIEKTNIINKFNISRENFKTNNTRKRILIPLQVQLDTNIVLYSKYTSMREFFIDVYKQLNNNDVQFVVRPHPEESPDTPINIPIHSNVKVTSEAPLSHWLSWADTVVTINSTVGLEALIRGCSVITLGESIYSNTGLTQQINSRNTLQDPDLHYERLLKYLALLMKRNIITEDSSWPDHPIHHQLNLTPLSNLPASTSHISPTNATDIDVYINLNLNEKLDLTYRKNKAPITIDWIKEITKLHAPRAKNISIHPIQHFQARKNFSIKINPDDIRLTDNDSRFNLIIDILGNIIHRKTET